MIFIDKFESGIGIFKVLLEQSKENHETVN
jgi:hypothetical protein